MNTYWEDLPDHLKANPFFHFSEETNYVPAWDKIRIADATPALTYALELSRKRADAIVQNKAKPTFRNTVEALDQAFSLVGYFYRILFAINARDEAEEKLRDQIEIDIGRQYFQTFTAIFSDKELFRRFEKLIEKPEEKKWTDEQKMIGGMYFNGFVENGVRMRPDKAKRYAKYQSDIYDLGLKIQRNIQRSEDEVFLFVDDKSRISGLPQALVGAAAEHARRQRRPGSWAFPAGRVTHESIMASADDRGLRKEMWELYHTACMKGPIDNRELIMRFMKLQHESAQFKDGRSPANGIIKYNMARTPQVVSTFLRQIRNVTKPVAEAELHYLKIFALQELGYDTLEPWDIEYAQEKMKSRLLGFDENDVRQYFELENTLEGTFRHFQKIGGVKFVETDRYPSYHPDTRMYYVVNARSGRHMGVLILDLFDRKGKMAGIAWNMSVLPQGLFEGKVRRPVDQCCMKLQKPTDPNQPVLMTHKDLETLWHEMGHALNNMISECRYSARSGTGLDQDVVEFPSQFHEPFTYNPVILDDVARHWETGEKMPEYMKKGIEKSQKFMSGMRVLERTMRGWLDFSWYYKNPASSKSMKNFEEAATRSFRLPGIAYPYHSPRFYYTFGGGYDCAFYSYQWSRTMSDPLYDAYEKRGLKEGRYDRTLTAQFKKALAVSGAAESYGWYRGINRQNPSLRAYLRRVGVTGALCDYSAAFTESANRPKVKEQAAGQSRVPEPALRYGS